QQDLSRWGSPLTAEGFAHWRNSLSDKKDRVERSDDLLRLDTTSESGPIKSATLVVRERDFHPVQQNIRFSDERTLELTELSFDVKDAPSSRPAPEPGVAGDVERSFPSTAVAGVVNSSTADLNEIEMAVRYAMFTEQLDLGEDLVISSSNNHVLVSGT